MKKTGLMCLLLVFALLFSVGGSYATWFYAPQGILGLASSLSPSVGEFFYTPPDMPTGEVNVIQRLLDILNKKYTTDKITDSLDYLLNETIQVYWGGNIYADPYVGSMDQDYAEQIGELFRDVLFESGVSFILKHQDLNGDGYKEVAMYSTSDPLTCVNEFDGIVCVYVSVFTPKLDESKNVVGYTLVCESLRGYCYEVYYGPGDPTPSFSTDEWRDDIGYYHYYDQCIYPVPKEAMSYDGQRPYHLDYNSYHQSYQYELWSWGATMPYGNWLGQCLAGKIPFYT